MVDEKGNMCSCGMRGCLETVSSGAVLRRYTIEGIEAGEMTLIKNMANGKMENISPHMIISATHNGDQFAISIISKVGFDLGKGIASLVQILDPEMTILARRLADAGSYLVTSVNQGLQQYSFAKSVRIWN